MCSFIHLGDMVPSFLLGVPRIRSLGQGSSGRAMVSHISAFFTVLVLCLGGWDPASFSDIMMMISGNSG